MTQGVDELTDREKEVLRLLLAGHTAKTAAKELDLSVHTINDYLREARKKLGVGSSREAARTLGEAENSPPNKLGHQEIGIALGDAVHQSDPANTKQARRNSRAAWIAGGFIMLASAVALALFVTSTGSTEEGLAHGQTATQQDSKAAELSALQWVALIDQGNWKGSWNEASNMFQQAVTADGWASQVNPVRSPLGAVASRQLHDVKAYDKLPGAPDGEYRIVTFTTDFAEAPASVETVVMVQEASAWKVAGYFIR